MVSNSVAGYPKFRLFRYITCLPSAYGKTSLQGSDWPPEPKINPKANHESHNSHLLHDALSRCQSDRGRRLLRPSHLPRPPVKVIVALPAGGSVDMIARQISQQLTTDLGQPFVVDNRAGDSGQIGVPVVAKAA